MTSAYGRTLGERRAALFGWFALAALAVIIAFAIGVAVGRRATPPATAAAGGAAQAPAVNHPGPTRVEAGIPVGYAHTREGAVAAATEYTVALGPMILDDARREAVLEAIATQEAKDDLNRQFAPGAALLRQRLGLTPEVLAQPGAVLRTIPAGYRVVAYGDDEAVIRVWAIGLGILDGRQPVGPSWSTTEVQLRWVDGDWKLHSSHIADGPTPPGPGDPQSALIGQEIETFQEYRHVPVQ